MVADQEFEVPKGLVDIITDVINPDRRFNDRDDSRIHLIFLDRDRQTLVKLVESDGETNAS